jgi:hypothetical protein
MRVPLFLLLISVSGVVVGVIWPGLADIWLVAVPSALASAILLLWEAVRGRGERQEPVARTERLSPARKIQRPGRAAPNAEPRWIVVDGSNVMYWKDNTPRIETVREVLASLAAQGFTAGVVFDANAGYLVSGRYEHHESLGRMVGLLEDRVMVVPKGQVADQIVLAAARDLGARVVTNDRYRDWAEQHPEVRDPGHLIRGGYRDGALWLALKADAVSAAAP